MYKFYLLFGLFLIVSCGGGGGGGKTEAPTPTSSYLITTSSGSNGSISPASTTVNTGQTTTFTITPDAGYVISTIAGCNGTLSDNSYTTGPISSSCSITVSFVKFTSTVFDDTPYDLPFPKSILENLCLEDPTYIPVFTSIMLPIDLNLDSYNDLIVHYWCGPKTRGLYKDSPTPDAIVAFINNRNNTFSIANNEVFGQKKLSLEAASRKVVKADFNGDGYLDILFALNREDGRAQSGDEAASSNEAPQSIILSNGNGTYSIADLGFNEWAHAVDTPLLPSGKFDAVISGFRSSTVTGLRYDGQSFQLINDYANPGGPTNRFGASTLRFFPEYATGLGSTLAISDSGDCGIQVNLSSFSKESGEWLFTDKTDFNCRNIPNSYESYTGELGDLPLVTINGQDYTGGGFGNEESCALKLSPGDAPVAIVQFSAQPIEGNYIDGVVYKQAELPIQNRLNVFEVSNLGLALKADVIINEDVDARYRLDACRDINNDGYDDIVLLQNSGSGGEQTNTRDKPIVFLNDKQNHLVRYDLDGIPQIDSANNFNYEIHGFLADLNGDLIEDLIYFRSSRSYINSTTLDPDMTNLIRIYWGKKDLK